MTTGVSADHVFSHVSQLWLALASLCVLDQDHVDRLSSGRWMGKDGQQKQMVRTVFKRPGATRLKMTD